MNENDVVTAQRASRVAFAVSGRLVKGRSRLIPVMIEETQDGIGLNVRAQTIATSKSALEAERVRGAAMASWGAGARSVDESGSVSDLRAESEADNGCSTSVTSVTF